MKNFVIVGSCGYIAPKHFQAIKETNNNLVAAYDITQNAGIIDKYFPESSFFFKFSEFEKFIRKFQRKKTIHYLVICAPNYLHNKFILFGLKNHMNVICEKPLILKTSQLIKISNYQDKYKRKVFCIMQLRLNKNVINFKKKIVQKLSKNLNNIIKCRIKYVTYRGDWFLKSWKGNKKKSGGLTTNIGIHLFDLITWFFGSFKHIKIDINNSKTSTGVIKFKNACVEWTISISDLYLDKKKPNVRAIRQFYFGENKLELSDNFNNMHILSYKKILNGKGFTIQDVKDSLYITEKLRNMSK